MMLHQRPINNMNLKGYYVTALQLNKEKKLRSKELQLRTR